MSVHLYSHQCATKTNATHRHQRLKRGLGSGFRCCLGLRAASRNRRLSKGHRNRIHTKLDPAPFLSRHGRRILRLPENSAFSRMTIILKFFFTHFYGRKVKLPSVSQNQRWKHFRSNPEQSSKNRKKKKKNKETTHKARARRRLSLRRLSPLCYVGVHFAVLRCSCQIFPLNQSFNALLDHYRTRKESRSQLLCDLWGGRHRLLALLCHYIREIPSLKCKQHICPLLWIYTV